VTHTYAILKVSKPAYDEIRRLLSEAGYEDQFHKGNGPHDHEGEVIDMHGIAIQADAAFQQSIPKNALCFFEDGDEWCCVRGDFINLQESKAGFGEYRDVALNALLAAEAET
jgi:hypothetical protein